MKLNLIYFSPTGGTKKTVEILSNTWNLEKNIIDISIPDKNYSIYSFSSDELCIIGVPSFGGRVPSVAIDHLKQMNSCNTPTILVATYGNRAYEDTLLELKDTAEECGFKIVAAITAVTEHSIMNQFATGRPNEEDYAEILNFGKTIKDTLSKNLNLSDLKIPGNRPYREYNGVPLKPTTSKDCHKCGICASLCPTNAIPKDNPNKTENTLCISCMRCISVCPNSARSLNKLLLLPASQKLKKVCSTPKKNELFIDTN